MSFFCCLRQSWEHHCSWFRQSTAEQSRGAEPLPFPASHMVSGGARDRVGFLGCQGTGLDHVDLLSHQPAPPSPSPPGCCESISTQAVLFQGVLVAKPCSSSHLQLCSAASGDMKGSEMESKVSLQWRPQGSAKSENLAFNSFSFQVLTMWEIFIPPSTEIYKVNGKCVFLVFNLLGD